MGANRIERRAAASAGADRPDTAAAWEDGYATCWNRLKEEGRLLPSRVSAGADPLEELGVAYVECQRLLIEARAGAQGGPSLDVPRLVRTLRAIHGNEIPLPNRPSPEEWAAIIADWYESDDPGHPGPHLRAARLSVGDTEERDE